MPNKKMRRPPNRRTPSLEKIMKKKRTIEMKIVRTMVKKMKEWKMKTEKRVKKAKLRKKTNHS